MSNMLPKFSFSWQNITVEVLEKTKTLWKTTVRNKTILNNVSGTAKSGSLFAIIGSSGCGKTTLLRAISGRCEEKTGILQINNKSISDADARDISGYVPQQDIFTEHLTVLEHLEFMAALQLRDKSKLAHQSIVNQLLLELSLEGHKPALVKNLSGGERRRLSLASELISNPVILFCDEPTTGLDSYNSLIVLEKLQTIAMSGKIVLVTIHQPSSQLFHYFDNITLLSEGKLVFEGSREGAKLFFEKMNLICPKNYNPADFYVRCITSEDVEKMCEAFKSQSVQHETYSDCSHNNILLEKKFKSNFFYELKWLLRRNFLSMKRNKGFYLGLYSVVMIELVIVSFFYSKVSLFDTNSVQNIQGFFGFVGSEITFTNMYSVINIFPSETVIYTREKTLYSSYAYFTSKVLCVVPLAFLTTIMYMTIIFTLIKFLNGFYLWFQMTYLMFLVSTTASALGLAFSASFSSIEHIELYLGPLEFLLLLFSGIMVKIDAIPLVFQWIKYISPFYYGFDSLSNLLWANLNSIGNCAENATLPCYHNGTEVLQNYGVYKTFDTVTYDIFYLHILTTVLGAIGYVGIFRKNLHLSI